MGKRLCVDLVALGVGLVVGALLALVVECAYGAEVRDTSSRMFVGVGP